LTPLLKRLEAQGRVRRARDPKDERHVRVGLTEPGHELRSCATEVPSLVARAMGRSADDLKALRKELRRVRAALLESHNPLNADKGRPKKAAAK